MSSPPVAPKTTLKAVTNITKRDKRMAKLTDTTILPEVVVECAKTQELYQIRWRVLRPLEKSPRNVHYEGDDATGAIHLKAVVDGKIVGCVSALPQPLEVLGGAGKAYRIRALAVLEPFRGKGIGRELMEQIIELARSRANTLWLSGRTHHRTWYEKFGFTVIGEKFDIKGTGPHYYFIMHARG